MSKRSKQTSSIRKTDDTSNPKRTKKVNKREANKDLVLSQNNAEAKIEKLNHLIQSNNYKDSEYIQDSLSKVREKVKDKIKNGSRNVLPFVNSSYEKQFHNTDLDVLDNSISMDLRKINLTPNLNSINHSMDTYRTGNKSLMITPGNLKSDNYFEQNRYSFNINLSKPFETKEEQKMKQKQTLRFINKIKKQK